MSDDWSMEPNDDKYVTFKRDEFMNVMGEWVAPQIKDALLSLILADAVVIRRQDFFASPALGTYAQCIALVARTTPDQILGKRLINVADYFQRQSELAAEEGYKFPD